MRGAIPPRELSEVRVYSIRLSDEDTASHILHAY
jgi:hypothetical protein